MTSDEFEAMISGVIETGFDETNIERAVKPIVREMSLNQSPNPEPDSYPRTLRIASSTTKGSYYEVKMLDHVSGVCHCKGFSYRNRCRHLDVARQIIQKEEGQ